jgi:hypothetical protein
MTIAEIIESPGGLCTLFIGGERSSLTDSLCSAALFGLKLLLDLSDSCVREDAHQSGERWLRF